MQVEGLELRTLDKVVREWDKQKHCLSCFTLLIDSCSGNQLPWQCQHILKFLLLPVLSLNYSFCQYFLTQTTWSIYKLLLIYLYGYNRCGRISCGGNRNFCLLFWFLSSEINWVSRYLTSKRRAQVVRDILLEERTPEKWVTIYQKI